MDNAMHVMSVMNCLILLGGRLKNQCERAKKMDARIETDKTSVLRQYIAGDQTL